MKRILLLLGALLATTVANAQTSPNWTYRYVPPNTEWNSLWASKQDYLGGSLDILQTGAKQDGVTDDAPAINRAITQAAAAGQAVTIHANLSNVLLGSPIVPVANTKIVCIGKPVLFLAAGAKTAVIESSTFQANIGSPGPLGDYGVSIQGCVIDGNRANQSASPTPDYQNGISIYGSNPVIQDVVVRGAFGNGIRLGGVIIAGTPVAEPTLTKLHVDNSGRNGIWVQGPSDGHFSDVIVVDASQAADNTYCGIRMDTTGRLINFHGWHQSAATNRVSYQGCMNAPVDVSVSHFEGGRRELSLAVGGSRIVGSEIYAGYGTSGWALIDIASNQNQLIGNSIQNNAGATDMYGVNFTSGASGNILMGNYYAGVPVKGPFNFTSDGGLNTIANDQGFMASGGATAFGGTVNPLDTITYYQGGSIIGVNRGPIYSAATLYNCNATSTNSTVSVSDASTPVYGNTVTLGGSTKAIIFCDGSNWRVH